MVDTLSGVDVTAGNDVHTELGDDNVVSVINSLDDVDSGCVVCCMVE